MEQAADVVQVLVVDDQAPFRAAARAVVARVQGFELVGEATSGEEAVELVRRATSRMSALPSGASPSAAYLNVRG